MARELICYNDIDNEIENIFDHTVLTPLHALFDDDFKNNKLPLQGHRANKKDLKAHVFKIISKLLANARKRHG